MKYIESYKKKIGCTNEDEVFSYLIDNLKSTITKWDYFVNWGKVFTNIENIEIELNLLNYLIGKDDVAQKFRELLKKHPSVIKIIPILVATRDKKFKILTGYNLKEFKYEDFSFAKKKEYTEEEIDLAVKFAKESGFLDIVSNKKIKNLVDYVIGVEVGLDSNGRKNRTGTMMESIVEFFVKDVCEKNGFQYLPQATSKKIKQHWDIELKVDKSSRSLDFAINTGKDLVLIETNFYGGGGSKLKSTAGEYKTMFDFWKNDGHRFVWITDGIGWEGTSRPLRETFEYTDCILNLEMVSNGLLVDFIKET